MKNGLILIFTFFSLLGHTQIKLSVQVLDKKNLKPIEFASVLLLDLYEGTITDTLGYFSIEVDRPNRLIMLQSLGFKSDTFLVSELQDHKIIYLEPADYTLTEVLVLPRSAFDIIRKTVSKLSENYFAPTIAQNVYYKQTLLANDKILSLQEANFNALAKFKNKNINLVSINKARAFIDIDTLKSLGRIVAKQLDKFDTTNVKENASQYFDMDFLFGEEIGENNTRLFGERGFKNYKYNYNGLVKKDGYYAYHITFDQLDHVKKSLYKGHLYVDSSSFALLEANAYLSPKGLEYQKVIPKSVLFVAKLLGYSIYVQGLAYYAHYKKVGEKWVLDKTDLNLKAKISKKNGPIFEGYLETKFVVDSFYAKEKFYHLKSNYDVLSSDIEDFMNDNFWENYFHEKLIPKERILLNKKYLE